MVKFRKAVFLSPLLAAVTLLPMSAQYNRNPDYGRQNRNYGNFNNGLRDGGRGGDYYNGGDDRRYHDDHYGDNRGGYNRGGIGPGKGALIGGAGGAVLGAVFGGGLKGTIIGGAAGAGIGAAVGGVAQSNRRDRYGRPY